MGTIELLKKLVKINSVFPNEALLAELVENYLQSLKFHVKRQRISKDRWNILGERGEADSAILLYGHLDTVPVYGNWKTDPFTLTSSGDRLYGLGACDMKGGLAIMLSALARITEKRKVKVLFCPDEENISEGAWQAVQNNRKWFADVKGILVGEPGASAAQTGGANIITLGRRGRAVFRINVYGKSAHGAHSEKGINAITEASKLALVIERMNLPSHPKLGKASLFIRKIEGSTTSLSLPDKAVIEIDRHLVLPESVNSVKKGFEREIKRQYKINNLSANADKKAIVSVKERVMPYAEPYLTSIKNPFVKNIMILARQIRKDVQLNYGKSVADDNIFATQLKLPVVTIGPEGANIHSANEWVSQKSISETELLYERIINSVNS